MSKYLATNSIIYWLVPVIYGIQYMIVCLDFTFSQISEIVGMKTDHWEIVCTISIVSYNIRYQIS